MRLRELRFLREDVFTRKEADDNGFFWLANALHAVTHESVLRREVWLTKGTPLDAATVDEVERNLRATPWLGAASAELLAVGDGEADLFVRTRDRLTLGGSASVSRVGGTMKLRAAVSEANLFGTGKRLAVNASSSGDDDEVLVQWFDPQFLDSWYRLSVEAGATDDGPFGRFSLVRPYKHREDPWTYGIEARYDDRALTYYSRGESFAELPEQGQRIRGFAERAFGPRELRTGVGADVRWRRSDYADLRGDGAQLFRQPIDSNELLFGPVGRVDWAPRYDKRKAIDALDFVEDLKLGIEAELRIAAALRDQSGDHQAALVFAPHLSAAAAPLGDTYVTLEATVDSRWRAGDAQGWRWSTAVHAFQKSLPRQTLAASFTYQAVYEGRDAPVQLTLGEDNGLRGYPARELSGSRVARLNLEDRIATGLEVWSVRVGAVGFCDVGWVHGAREGLSMGDEAVSAGVGLRFGSSHLLGRKVVRLDVAWPLLSVDGERSGMSVSFAVGQVFSFFGNAEELVRLP